MPRHGIAPPRRCDPAGTFSRLGGPTLAARGRPRRRHVPDILSMPAEDMLANAKWQTVSWRTGTKGRLKARFAAIRVRTADGSPQRIRDKGQQHLPGDEAWLIGEHRTSGEKKFYLATLRGDGLAHLGRHHQGAMGLRAGPSAAQRGTRPRSLEGRSWQGLHRHALMTMIAYAFLQQRRLTKARRGKKITGPPPQPSCRPCDAPSSTSSPDRRLSNARTADDRSSKDSRVSKSAKVVLARLSMPS